MRSLSSLFPLVLLLTVASLPAWAKPPTLDPTYGLPLPRASSHSGPEANWIWADTTSDNQTIFLRRAFFLSVAPKAAIFSVTADDFFTLFVDGRLVDQSKPDPADKNVWQRVHHIDLAPYLAAGDNVIAIQARNEAAAAGVVAQLEILGQPPLVTDHAWKVWDQPQAPTGWNTDAFDDRSWASARIEAPVFGGVWSDAGGLDSWPEGAGAPYLAHLTLRPVAVERLSGEEMITGVETLTRSGPSLLRVQPAAPGAAHPAMILLDFGKEVAGRVQITGPTGASVTVGTGESRDECLNAPWGGTHRLACLTDTPVYSPYSAFRYATIAFTGTRPYAIRGIALDFKYYPVHYKGAFACSDPLLTKIWYTGAYTAHLCMQEDIWDAPKRDRMRWVGDLHVSGEVVNNVFADTFLMEQTLTRLRADAQQGVPMTDLPKNHVNGIPGYSCAWICAQADFYRHVGDLAYLNHQHDALISLLEYLRGDLGGNGLFANRHNKWCYVDWSPGFDGTTPLTEATTHLFLVKAVRESVFLLTEMGDTQNAAKYAAWAGQLTDTARQFLPDPKTQTYSDRRQENAMAVYSGVATPAQQAALYASVLKPGSPDWDKVESPYYGNYVLAALAMMGHTQDGLDFLRSYWGGMLAEGATTWWEGYDPHWEKDHFHAHLQADNNTGYQTSLCHGWSAGPTSFLTERVLGVRPTGGGFRTAEIVPDLGDLAWASGAVPTPHGLLRVRAAKSAHGMTVSVILPDGIDASVGVPGKTIMVNGKRIAPSGTREGRSYVRIDKAGAYVIEGRN